MNEDVLKVMIYVSRPLLFLLSFTLYQHIVCSKRPAVDALRRLSDALIRLDDLCIQQRPLVKSVNGLDIQVDDGYAGPTTRLDAYHDRAVLEGG